MHPTENQKLNKKQQRFITEFLIDCNPTLAAKRAGYSEKFAKNSGKNNLNHPIIALSIAQNCSPLQIKKIIYQLPNIILPTLLKTKDPLYKNQLLSGLSHSQSDYLVSNYWQKALINEDFEAIKLVKKIDAETLQLPAFLPLAIKISLLQACCQEVMTMDEIEESASKMIRSMIVFRETYDLIKNHPTADLEDHFKETVREKMVPFFDEFVKTFDSTIDDLPIEVSHLINTLVYSYKKINPSSDKFEARADLVKSQFNQSLYFYKNIHYWLLEQKNEEYQELE